MDNQEHIENLLKRFTHAMATQDAGLFKSCFTPDAVYHDYIYGEYKGHAGIEEMFGLFFRDARDYRWSMIEPVSNGAVAYSYWVFSYVPTLAKYESKRIVIEGTSRIHLKDGLIQHYAETTNGGVGMVQLGVDAPRIAKVLNRWADDLKGKPLPAEHLKYETK